MRPNDLSMLSDADRDKGAAALDAAFAITDVHAVVSVGGGASGAHVHRVATDDGDFLLRIEGARRMGRSPHQYTCLSAAAAAGVAPPVRHLDADAGVVVMPPIGVGVEDRCPQGGRDGVQVEAGARPPNDTMRGTWPRTVPIALEATRTRSTPFVTRPPPSC